MIKLTDLIKINPKDYKLHLAVTSEEGVNPLDVFIRDKDEWKLWQAHRGSKNEWTRPYIFSLIKFHNFWLFGGIYTVIAVDADGGGTPPQVILLDDLATPAQ